MESIQNLVSNYNSPDSLITQEVLKAISSFSCGESASKTIKSLISSGWKIFAVFLVHHYLIKNPQYIVDFLKIVGRMIAYRKIKLQMGKVDVELTMARKIQSLNGESVNGLPVYCTKDGTDLIVEYCPVTHSSYMKEVKETSEREFEEYKSKQSTKIKTLTGKSIEPKELFPSRNFLKFENLVYKFFTVKKKTKMFRSLGVIINGRPGIGKSDSLAYIAQKNVVENAIYADMTKNLDKSFEEVIKTIYSNEKVGEHIVYIDELDKYLNQRLVKEYKLKCETIIENNKKSEIQSLVPSWEEYLKEAKIDFIYMLLNLIETENFTGGVIFVFCSNDFETILEGIDEMHTRSLRRRFLELKFELCGCEEFKDYVRFFNEKMSGTEDHVKTSDLELILDDVRDDLAIPFSNIYFSNIEACFNPRRLVELVNDWVDTYTGEKKLSPPSSPSIRVEYKSNMKEKSLESESSENSSTSGSKTQDKPQTVIMCDACEEDPVVFGKKYCEDCITECETYCSICRTTVDVDDCLYCDNDVMYHCKKHFSECKICNDFYCIASSSGEHDCPVCHSHGCLNHYCETCHKYHSGLCEEQMVPNKKENFNLVPETLKDPVICTNNTSRQEIVDTIKKLLAETESAVSRVDKLWSVKSVFEYMVKQNKDQMKELYITKFGNALREKIDEFNLNIDDEEAPFVPELKKHMTELDSDLRKCGKV